MKNGANSAPNSGKKWQNSTKNTVFRDIMSKNCIFRHIQESPLEPKKIVPHEKGSNSALNSGQKWQNRSKKCVFWNILSKNCIFGGIGAKK